ECRAPRSACPWPWLIRPGSHCSLPAGGTQAMTSIPHSRRDVPKAAVAATAAASVGFASRRAEGQAARQIDGVLRQAVDAREVPGVVAMAATDKGVMYEGGAGARSSEIGAPAMTTDTLFRIASMTKAITSVAAMQLVEQGKLTLDG